MRIRRLSAPAYRSGWLLVVAIALLGACSEAEPSSDSNPVAHESPSACYELGWQECPDEPYPFATPLPPAELTPIDGTYTRVVDEDLAGAPGKCTRCPPYRLEPGTETLTFDRGRFFIEHDPPGFTSSGHFWVEGPRLRLFNDANCTDLEGVYEWNLSGELLRLEAIEDECSFTRLRQRYLTATDWQVARAGTAMVPPECYPPSEEAAVTGHWAIPEECSRANAG